MPTETPSVTDDYQRLLNHGANKPSEYLAWETEAYIRPYPRPVLLLIRWTFLLGNLAFWAWLVAFVWAALT